MFTKVANGVITNKRLLRQNTGGACLYNMPQDGHWLATFEVIPPPKKLVFPRPKNENSPLKTAVSDPTLWRYLFFRGENFVTPFSTLANIKGSLPTNSTTPNRLRCRTTTGGEEFSGFGVRTSSFFFFRRSGIRGDLHPKRSR